MMPVMMKCKTELRICNIALAAILYLSVQVHNDATMLGLRTQDSTYFL